jgi:hypothetical protein
VEHFPNLLGVKVWKDVLNSFAGKLRNYSSSLNFSPLVIFLAFIAIAFIIPRKAEALLLAAFSAAYAAIYWIMLPEVKHITPLVIPWCMYWSLACLTGVTLARRSGRAQLAKAIRKGWKPWGAGLALLALAYAMAYGGAYFWSSHKRQGYLGLVREGQTRALAVPESILDERTAAVYFLPNTLEHDQGMLWEIASDGKGGDIEIISLDRHQRQLCILETFSIPREEHTVYLYRTIRQYAPVRDLPCNLLINLPPGSRFVAASAFSLAAKEILPFQTVFTQNDTSPGSRKVNGPSVKFLRPGAKNYLEFQDKWQTLQLAPMRPVL